MSDIVALPCASVSGRAGRAPELMVGTGSTVGMTA